MSKNIVVGLHAVTAVLDNQAEDIAAIYYQSGRVDKRMQSVIDKAKSKGIKQLTQMAKHELDKRFPSLRHQGIVTEMKGKQKSYSEGQLLDVVEAIKGPKLILVLDGVTDPHNLGACLRSADAAGAQLVIAPKDKSVGLTPAARKVACGAAETVPFIAVTNLVRTIQQLQQLGVWFYGAAGEAKGTLYDVDLKGDVGIVMGAEGSGLRRLTRETCDGLFKIPMLGTVESLNVSVATGICLFETLRQRG